MRRLGFRPQRTLIRPVTIFGRGFLSGQRVRLRLCPAAADTGLVFVRTDLPQHAEILASWELVSDTRRRTTLGRAPTSVALVEHVLAALAGLRIDNCWIELDGPELPGMDGSAGPFVELLLQAGVEEHEAARDIWTVNSPLTVQRGSATLTLYPAETDELRISYLLDYGADSPIVRQQATLSLTPSAFVSQVAHCRTFVLEHEADELRRQGIGRHIMPSDILVFGPRGPLDNRLRHANEPSRHKILDIVGDLALLGCDLRGHIVGFRSGHPLNFELVRSLGERLPQRTAAGMLCAA